jgi:hypothetical protein
MTSEEDEEDEEDEEFKPPCVHDVKMGKVAGSRGTCILYQVEWMDWPNVSDFT